MMDEYIRNDSDRANGHHGYQTVFDSVDTSPFYDNSEQYIDERDLIELPPPTQNSEGQINEPYQKRYYFNPMNLPYNLEQSHVYSSRQAAPGEKNSVTERKGPRLNRYYETLKPYYKKRNAETDSTLIFESRFESGNLYLAQKVSDQEYNLLMQNDINTQGHTQWFYFRVCNTRKGHSVRFNILNYSKPDSLYNYGMRVSTYSDKKAHNENIGWFKSCTNIDYSANGIRKGV